MDDGIYGVSGVGRHIDEGVTKIDEKIFKIGRNGASCEIEVVEIGEIDLEGVGDGKGRVEWGCGGPAFDVGDGVLRSIDALGELILGETCAFAEVLNVEKLQF